MKRIASISRIIGLVGIDQLLKFIYKKIPGQIFIHQGILWSDRGGGIANLKIGIALCLLALLGYTLFSKKENNWLIKDKSRQTILGLDLMVAGGISNMFDWIFYSGIVNIFSFGSLNFNPADIYIVVGGLLLLIPTRQFLSSGYGQSP